MPPFTKNMIRKNSPLLNRGKQGKMVYLQGCGSPLKLSYKPFADMYARPLNPTIEHGRDRNNYNEHPTPEGTKCYDMVPPLLFNIVKNII